MLCMGRYQVSQWCKVRVLSMEQVSLLPIPHNIVESSDDGNRLLHQRISTLTDVKATPSSLPALIIIRPCPFDTGVRRPRVVLSPP